MIKKLIPLLFPLFLFTQTQDIILENKPKLFFSSDLGLKFYTGNLFLGQHKYSREGLYFNFNVYTKKKLNINNTIIFKSSLRLSNSISKKISVPINFNDIETENSFTTNIPNIFSCNINFSLYLNKKINRNQSHSLGFDILLQPLFYKKGNLLNGELSSFGALVSSEENGSLPSLEKPFVCFYQIDYLISETSIIKFIALIKSDFKLNSSSSFTRYPGFAINFEKLININK